MTTTCPGPLVWFGAADNEGRPDGHGAVLECARPECGYFIATGWFHDEAHAEAPLLREGVG